MKSLCGAGSVRVTLYVDWTEINEPLCTMKLVHAGVCENVEQNSQATRRGTKQESERMDRWWRKEKSCNYGV